MSSVLIGILLLGAGTLVTRAADRDAGAWRRHTIDAADRALGKLGADGVRLADANGDGLPDVVTGWEEGDAIRVCLHPGYDKVRRPWPAVTVGRVADAEDAFFCDLDGDGHLDVVSCAEGRTRSVFVHWAPAAPEHYLSAAAWETVAVPALQGQQMWMFGLPFDVNGDGRDDLILGSKNAGAAVGWLERPREDPRDLGAGRYHRLCDAGWIMSIRAVDLDGDGDLDVVFSDRKGPATGVWYLENVGRGRGESGSLLAPPRRLGLAGDEVMFVDIADIDGDGRLDVAAAVRPRQIAVLLQPQRAEEPWVERRISYPADTGSFTTGTAKAVACFHASKQQDVWRFVLTCELARGDAHGALLISVAPSGLGPLAAATVESISGPAGAKFDRIELLDLDGDGDLDVMTCEEQDQLGVFWYENPER